MNVSKKEDAAAVSVSKKEDAADVSVSKKQDVAAAATPDGGNCDTSSSEESDSRLQSNNALCGYPLN